MVPPPPPPAWPAKPKPFVGFGLLQDAGNVMFMDEVASKEVDGKTVEVEWTLGALVFDLRDGTEGATSLIGKVPGGGSTNFASGFALTLREFLVSCRLCCPAWPSAAPFSVLCKTPSWTLFALLLDACSRSCSSMDRAHQCKGLGKSRSVPVPGSKT